MCIWLGSAQGPEKTFTFCWLHGTTLSWHLKFTEWRIAKPQTWFTAWEKWPYWCLCTKCKMLSMDFSKLQMVPPKALHKMNSETSVWSKMSHSQDFKGHWTARCWQSSEGSSKLCPMSNQIQVIPKRQTFGWLGPGSAPSQKTKVSHILSSQMHHGHETNTHTQKCHCRFYSTHSRMMGQSIDKQNLTTVSINLTVHKPSISHSYSSKCSHVTKKKIAAPSPKID